MSNSKSIVELIQADMNEAVRQMNAQLARDFFKPNPLYDHLRAGAPPVPPTPRRTIWTRKVRWYLSNLWDAVRGIEHECDCADY